MKKKIKIKKKIDDKKEIKEEKTNNEKPSEENKDNNQEKENKIINKKTKDNKENKDNKDNKNNKENKENIGKKSELKIERNTKSTQFQNNIKNLNILFGRNKLNKALTMIPKHEGNEIEKKKDNQNNNENFLEKGIKYNKTFVKKNTTYFSQLERPSNYGEIDKYWNFEKNIIDFKILEFTSKLNNIIFYFFKL